MNVMGEIRMQNILLSLIVPIYGVEAYLKRFLDSLENNLEPGIEVILVDDCIKDNCGKIIDEFATKKLLPHVYVRAIHKQNGGVSSARNVGLNIAKGEYVLFADPDDYFGNESIINILNTIKLYKDLDMIIFDYYEENNKRKFLLHNVAVFQNGFVDKENLLEEFIYGKNLLGHLFNKVLRKALLEDIKFQEDVNYMEDYAFLTDVSLKVEKVYYLPMPVYYYCYNSFGLSKMRSINDRIKAFYITKERYKKYTDILNKKLFNAPAIQAIDLICLKYRKNEQFDVSEFEKYIRKNIRMLLMDNRIKFNIKKQFLLVYLGIAKWYFRFKK